MENFHILIGIATVIHYALLRKLLKKSNNDGVSKKNYIIYILFLPILLYTFYYIFKSKQNITESAINLNNTQNVTIKADLNSSSSILTMPYPDSSDISITSM